jgi:tetratricopeptide (TPR) repeat protein
MHMDEAVKEIQAGERKLAEMDFEGAFSKFKKAAKLDPSSPDAYFGMAEAALGVPKVPAEEVIASYKRATELQGDNPFFHARLGAFCLDAGQWELAEQSYNKAAETDPENGYLYLSEFGLEYYHARIAKLDADSPPRERDEVARKALKYLLRAMKLSEQDALKLLKGP